jgi:hypothetical protein
MERTTMQVGHRSHLLAQGQDLDKIRHEALQAVRNGGDLLQVTVVGNRTLDILISEGVEVTFETETVPDDSRDDGNLEVPFDVVDFQEFGL